MWNFRKPNFSIWGVFTLFFQDIVNTIFSSIKYERKYVKKQLFLGLYRFADTELFTTVMSINSLKYSAKLPWLHSSSVVLIRGFWARLPHPSSLWWPCTSIHNVYILLDSSAFEMFDSSGNGLSCHFVLFI